MMDASAITSSNEDEFDKSKPTNVDLINKELYKPFNCEYKNSSLNQWKVLVTERQRKTLELIKNQHKKKSSKTAKKRRM